jgi:hypothetical protein
VARLYPQALGTHFSRLLRHACVTVGLFFNPGHHTGMYNDKLTKCNDVRFQVLTAASMKFRVFWYVAPR